MERICGKYALHCNCIDPFVTIMGNFNWGPISHSDIVSSFSTVNVLLQMLYLFKTDLICLKIITVEMDKIKSC